MSVGFGFSVGDFFAALQLVGTIIDALRESSHSRTDFRLLLDELCTLESSLLQVKRLDLSDEHRVERLALHQAASQCQRTIDAFWKKTQRYQPHLQSDGGTGSRLKDDWAKIKWAVCKKDDVETFRAQIRGHTNSITILLLTTQMGAMNTHAHSQDAQHTGLAGRIQRFSNQVMGKLGSITESLAESVQQGKLLLEATAQVVQTNLRVFQIMHDAHLLLLRLPGQVQRQQPVYMIDPFNRESPFHLEFVRSSDALLAVLKVNLRESECGPEMIDRGEFTIEELGTQSKVDIMGDWGNCFYPGQRVAMSMVFELPKVESSSCPRCETTHDESTEKQCTCKTCGTVFRRIEELDQDSQEPDISNPVIRPIKPPRKKKREEEAVNTLTNLRKFRRIQVISTSVTTNPTAGNPSPSSSISPLIKPDEWNIQRTQTLANTFDKPVSTSDRWAQIRKNAAERQRLKERNGGGGGTHRRQHNQSNRSENSETSEEETIESRVARIKARVAELTADLNFSATGLCAPSAR